MAELFGPVGDKRYAEYVKDIHASGEHLLSVINDILDMSQDRGRQDDHALRAARPARRGRRRRAPGEGPRRRGGPAPVGGHGRPARDRGRLPRPEAVCCSTCCPTPSSSRRAAGPCACSARPRAVPTGSSWCRSTSRTPASASHARDLARLASPFEQVESQHAKTQQGTGLGLALSKALIGLHGGDHRHPERARQGHHRQLRAQGAAGPARHRRRPPRGGIAGRPGAGQGIRHSAGARPRPGRDRCSTIRSWRRAIVRLRSVRRRRGIRAWIRQARPEKTSCPPNAPAHGQMFDIGFADSPGMGQEHPVEHGPPLASDQGIIIAIHANLVPN